MPTIIVDGTKITFPDATEQTTKGIAETVLTTQGDIITRDASVPKRLAKGTAGQLLIAGANEPEWADNSKTITRELSLPTYGYHDILGNFEKDRTPFRFLDNEVLLCKVFLKVPEDFISFVSVKFVWRSDAVVGNMYWRIRAYYGAAGEAWDTHSDAPDYGVTATGGRKIRNEQLPANPLTLVNLALGDYIMFVLTRNASHANDTLSENVEGEGLLFTYTAYQINPGV